MSPIRSAIIVTAYKRIDCLELLLRSLADLTIPEDVLVDLRIYIDGSDVQRDVAAVCDAFEWQYGEKEIVCSPKRLGLKANVLKAFRSLDAYDFFVLLEDDLYLSKFAFKFAVASYEQYKNERSIIGASLYSYDVDEISLNKFTAFTDGLDIFAARVPSSWGCVYWDTSIGQEVQRIESEVDETVLPHNVKRWSSQSWKKDLYYLMISRKLSLIYPAISLSTIVSQKGQHQTSGRSFGVPLSDREIRLPAKGTPLAHYDEYLEISKETLQRLNPALRTIEFEVNLRNQKPGRSKATLIRGRSDNKSLMSFNDAFFPLEIGVIRGIEGEGIVLSMRGHARGFEAMQMFRNLRASLSLASIRRALRTLF